MMPIEEWKSGLQVWQNLKKQAEVSLETADLIIPVFEAKIKSMEEEHGE